jgi:hypothetical protein
MANLNVKNYQAFRGVDYSTSPAVISEERASDLLNMYVGEDGVMQKRPGWRVLRQFNDGINGIHHIQFSPGNGTLFIHSGTELWYVLMSKSWRHITGEDTPYFKTINDLPTLEDVQMIRDYVEKGMDGVQPWQVKNMDINGDGRVTLEDAQILYDYIVNLAQASSNGVLASAYKKVQNNGSDLELQNTKSTSFTHDGQLYILDGEKYVKISPEYATVTNLLDTSTLYDGVIQADGTLDDD